MFDPDNFSKTICHLRRRVKWSMDYAAHQCGFSVALWAKLEYKKINNPTINTILRIANTFGFSLDELINRKVPKLKPQQEEKLPAYFLTNEFYKLK